MLLYQWILLLFLPLVSASGLFDFIFGSSKAKATESAILDLPYGSFKAEYNDASDIHVFRNVPYAAPPVGELRWAKPAPLVKQFEGQKIGAKPTCPQAIIDGINLMGTGNDSPIGSAINQFLGGLPIPSFGQESEDCLYMDIFVPSKAIKNPKTPLPVVVYIFGGGYILGSKDIYQPSLPFYDGSGLISQSDNNMIFITFNYRLGAFGFLAGSSMEKDGLPNAGLWDQRAVFEWVQSYIHLLGGDPKQVTAMGESAGASSIMHHLVAEGGTKDPLFSKAILLSPAFQPMWDRAGRSEEVFQQFERLAGCEGQGLACLRKADASKLITANHDLMLDQVLGTFAVGPTPDGSFIRQLPVLELATGNFWKIESLLTSHCSNEAILFVDGSITTNADFDNFLAAVFSNYTVDIGLNEKASAFYPAVGGQSKYKSQTDRTSDFVRDSSMTCNIRYLNEAYGESKVWNMQYSVAPGWHATDLIAVFYNKYFSSSSWDDVLKTLVLLPLGIVYSGISTALQSYLASYAVHGDPNTDRVILNLPPTVKWNHPRSSSEVVGRVVDVGNILVREIEDTQMPKSACDFWREFYAAATAEGGYVPPGAAVPQSLVKVKSGASQKYRG
ncbi:hypothetical protein jhhlp_003197 [Lomentospora prolificans]|uniref:Carboxylesterase type B domain-containing protein n=1 Tax=Lomentospora prolificans TaxID=41688 RepID=A0A2N3NG78_9PEZI|nr:hypothetical protein jhhlp_003197 [Lomentospora prolificans]